MEKNTRDWRSSMTRITDVYPAMMPITIVVCSATDGKRWITVATGEASPWKILPRVRTHRRVPEHGGQGVGGVHAPAGERKQDRCPVGEADQCGGGRDRGDGRRAAERYGAALHEDRYGARRVHVPDEAASRDLSESGRRADGRRRHR